MSSRALVQFSGRTIGARLRGPNRMRLAESFGVAARRVATSKKLERALEAELGLDRHTGVELGIEPAAEAPPWVFIDTRPSELLRG